MAKNEAVFLPINCIGVHRTFYARYDFSYDGVWVLTYGLRTMPTDTPGESSESDFAKIDLSNSRTGPQYRCPHCGNTEYVRCGACGKLTCYSGHGDFVCDHCGNRGSVSGHIDSLEIDALEGNRKRSQR